jgi:hypothetical protein
MDDPMTNDPTASTLRHERAPSAGMREAIADGGLAPLSRERLHSCAAVHTGNSPIRRKGLR